MAANNPAADSGLVCEREGSRYDFAECAQNKTWPEASLPAPPGDLRLCFKVIFKRPCAGTRVT